MTILVTGGSGFIGSNFILEWLSNSSEPVINLDKLTYAGNPENLGSVEDNPNYCFVHAGIEDLGVISELLRSDNVRAIVNFAAESHVDKSIHSPEIFVQTNVLGTLKLLEASKDYFQSLDDSERKKFRFLHVSTDEIYGSLLSSEPPFSETSQIKPNSPYAASKAGSDHLVRSYGETYGLPVLITNCSNNYGPYQFPEKLIPLIIHRALSLDTLPVYGDGMQVRDWLYVTDHCAAICRVLEEGRTGRTYNIGGNNEKTNIEVVKTLCAILDELKPRIDGSRYEEQIRFVVDRLGHDRRYAIDASRIAKELSWEPTETFETGIRKTAAWYLDNVDWVKNVTSGAYKGWIESHYSSGSAGTENTGGGQ